MERNEYQRLSIQTSQGDYGMPSVAYYTLGMSGEAGELLEKITFTQDAEGKILELGDVLWYFSAILLTLGINLGDCERQVHQPVSPFQSGLRLSLDVARFSERIKKLFRDGKGLLSPERVDSISYNADIIYSRICDLSESLGHDLEYVMVKNREKLLSRYARGVTGGEGDNR